MPAALALLLGTASAARAAEDPDMARLLTMDLGQLSEIRSVTAAGRFPQKLSEAPSRVSIVTADEMRAYGHRNLADVVRFIRGLHTGYDGSYEIAGTRGVAPSGDYNTRLLVTIDGIRITDSIYSQGPVGNEFPLDLEMIERVEFLPGPGSAAYGNNAFFGVLNVVTRKPSWAPRREIGLAAGSDGEAQGRLTFDQPVGDEARLLLSVNRDYRSGPHIRFPAFAEEGVSDGIARDMDSEAASRLFARLDTQSWQFRLLASDRVKTDPSAPFGTPFNDPRTQQRDRFVQAAAQREFDLPQRTEAGLQLYYNRYEFRGDYPYDDPAVVNHDFAQSERYGAEARLRTRRFDGHVVSGWAEYTLDATMRMVNRDLDPPATYLDDDRSEHAWGFFVQDEIALGKATLLDLGLRHDRLNTGDTSTNPRLALIVQAGPDTTAKLLYGSAFRSPNAFERFYAIEDYSLANPDLKPERVRTLEATLEREGRDFRLAASLFRSSITDLIELVGLEGDLIRFENRASAQVRGAELEGEFAFAAGTRLRASLTAQHATDGDSGEVLPNSPRLLANFNAIVPLGARWRAGLEARYEGGRDTQVATRTGGHALLNLNLSGESAAAASQWAIGIHNLLDRRYDLPATVEHVQDRLPQRRRSVLVSFTRRF